MQFYDRQLFSLKNELIKSTLILTILILSFTLHGQSLNEVKNILNQTNDLNSATSLQYKHQTWTIELMEADSTGHYADKQLDVLQTGEILVRQERGDTFSYKLVEKRMLTEFRVSHIFLFATDDKKQEIDDLRSKIIAAYNNGTSFAELAKQYSHYPKPTDGDLGWFESGVMVSEFESEIKKYQKGDIFIVDIPSKKWYFVVLKTHDDRIRTSKILLKIKSS